MVTVTFQQTINEQVSFLMEQINPYNTPQLNSTFQIPIEAIRSAAEDLEKVEAIIIAKKGTIKEL